MLEVIDCRSDNASKEFSQSLEEIGFAVIANHGVSQELIEQAYADWEQFFAGVDKFNFQFDPKTHDGYIGLDLSETAKGHELKDIKEFFHYYPWGRVPENLKDITANLYVTLNQLASKLLLWVEQALPQAVRQQLSMPLSDMIKGSKHTLLRIINYPPLNGDEPAGAVRAAAHEDINLLTVLPAATAEGLEVKDKSDRWLPVPVRRDWIIINSGDMLAECTQNFFTATSHRVVNPVGEKARVARLAMPLFLHPCPEVKLSNRHTAESYRQERFQELGLHE